MICFSILRSKVFVIRQKVLCYEPWLHGYKCKDHEVLLLWFWMSVCFVQWAAQYLWLSHLTVMQRYAVLVMGFSNVWTRVESTSEDVLPRCLNNSLLAIRFHLIESYTSHYLLVFCWYIIKQSPQCSGRFQIYSAVHERFIDLHHSEGRKSMGRNVGIL